VTGIVFLFFRKCGFCGARLKDKNILRTELPQVRFFRIIELTK